MKQNILNTVSDLVSSFLYYDRKEDENLKVNAINNAIKEGIISEEEIVQKFKDEFHKGLKI
jgi:hypothetical protein